MQKLLLIPFFLLVGCVMPGDLREIAGSLDRVAEKQEMLETGQITSEEFVSSLEEEVMGIKTVADQAVSRSGSLVKTLVGGIASNPMETIITMLTGLGGAAYASSKVVNHQRDAKRKARNEPV